jgi:hypothetical protein
MKNSKIPIPETTQELDRRNPKIQEEIKNSSITPILPLIRPTQEHPKKSSHSRNNPRKPIQTLARFFPSPIRLMEKMPKNFKIHPFG